MTIYLSVDVETDGPIPGSNSMLSLGAVAIDLDGFVYGEFECNLETLTDADPDPETMKWWATQPDAWAAHRVNPREPSGEMWRYRRFLESLPYRPVFMGYPAGFDFMFHHWYLIKFTQKDPCGFQALDLKSFAAAALKLPYRESTKRNYPKSWFGSHKHAHTALSDAREQAALGVNMLKERYRNAADSDSTPLSDGDFRHSPDTI